jgi:hypothetical protein
MFCSRSSASLSTEKKITEKKSFQRKKLEALEDVLACSITTAGIGRRTTGDLSTATKEAGDWLNCACHAPPFWRTAPDQVLKRRRIERGRRGPRGWRGIRRCLLVLITGSRLLRLLLRLKLQIDDGRSHLWNRSRRRIRRGDQFQSRLVDGRVVRMMPLSTDAV